MDENGAVMNNIDKVDLDELKFKGRDQKAPNRSASCAVKHGNNEVLIIGGIEKKKAVKTVKKFTSEKTWKDEKIPMQQNRCSFTVGMIKSRIYVVGGHGENEKGSSLSTIEMIDFDMKDPKWSIFKKTEQYWAGHSMVVL